jgi:hypothetical protein
MRVLVPYSGLGTNSTYGLYRLLTETDHEIIALHLNMYYSSDEYSAWEREHFHKGVKWFKDNTRDFKTVEGVCSRFYSEDLIPLREGSPYMFDNSHQSNRAKTYMEATKEFNVDLISSGRSAEDINGFRGLGEKRMEIRVTTFEELGLDFIIPSWSITERLTLENRNRVIDEMSAKWSQREKLPQELRNIITNCRCKGNQLNCYWCDDLLINEVRSETGQELDDIVLEKLCAGKFRHLVDLETWRGSLDRHDHYKKVLGFDFSGDWPTFEKLEEEMRDRARDMYAKAGNI